MRVLSRKHIRYSDDNKDVARFEISVNSASELPAKDGGIPGAIIDEGSIAWDIDTGDFYGMKESGVWKKQGDDEESSSVSSLSLNRQGLMKSEPITLKSDIEETISDPEGESEEYPESVEEPIEEPEIDEPVDFPEGIPEDYTESEPEVDDHAEPVSDTEDI
jgi:hypothetical protein